MSSHALSQWVPALKDRTLWLGRDQWVLLLTAVNQLFLSLDTYLVHVLNGTILFREWIPIIFGLVAGGMLLVAGVLAYRQRPLATWLATVVLIASIVVGVLGAYFHLIRGILPTAPLGQRVTLELLIWAPPVLAPFAFAGVGLMGLSAAWVERPNRSGRLQITSQRTLQLPYSKAQAYVFLVSLGILVAVVSSILDHARHEWENPWLWLPVVIGIFATIVSCGFGLLSETHKTDIMIYVVTMVLLVLLGVIGAYFHIASDLTASNLFVTERFLRGAPVLSPLLFSNMGMLGLIIILEPNEAVD